MMIRVATTYLSILSLCAAQYNITTGKVDELYQQHCMSCHGPDLKGGLGNSLLDKSQWKEVGKTTDFLEYVKKGNALTGMPSFEDGLTDPQIRSLEIYIDEVIQKTAQEEVDSSGNRDGVYQAGGYDFYIETVVDGLEKPWSLAFLPDGALLITEKNGHLRQFVDGVLSGPVKGTPAVHTRGQAGLLEVALHPQFSQNGWIYLGYVHSIDGADKLSMTKVVRGRIRSNTWQDEEILFEAPVENYRASGAHFGTRFVFKDGYLFFGIGDRGVQGEAQDLSLPNGKIHRIHDDGRVPLDNPYAQTKGSYPTIWTYGNRNPQGLDLHPLTGEIWESEHGPRGGDEINLIAKGKNYGWPTITYGMNYNGTPITEKTKAEGMEQPKHYWTPSIAVCGIDFYEGDAFPSWKHDLFVGGLASKQLHRLVLSDQKVVSDEIILKDIGRVRDVGSGPDGYLYLVLNNPDKIVKLVRSEVDSL